MTPEEAREKLIDSAAQDEVRLKNLLESYRIDTGISTGLFIEILGAIVQDYRIMVQIFRK